MSKALGYPGLSQATCGLLALEHCCGSNSACRFSLDMESHQKIVWILEWLREAKVGLQSQCRANSQNETAQTTRKMGSWWEKKTFHASQLYKTIARCSASHKPKIFNKLPVSELVDHCKSSRIKIHLISIVGNRPCTGNWGINMSTQGPGCAAG